MDAEEVEMSDADLLPSLSLTVLLPSSVEVFQCFGACLGKIILILKICLKFAVLPALQESNLLKQEFKEFGIAYTQPARQQSQCTVRGCRSDRRCFQQNIDSHAYRYDCAYTATVLPLQYIPVYCIRFTESEL